MIGWTSTRRVEPPAPAVSVAAVDPPPRLEQHERMRISAAAFRATRLYPGPVGELVSRELATWTEFGFRLDQHGHAARLVHHILTTPMPPGGHANGLASPSQARSPALSVTSQVSAHVHRP